MLSLQTSLLVSLQGSSTLHPFFWLWGRWEGRWMWGVFRVLVLWNDLLRKPCPHWWPPQWWFFNLTSFFPEDGHTWKTGKTTSSLDHVLRCPAWYRPAYLFDTILSLCSLSQHINFPSWLGTFTCLSAWDMFLPDLCLVCPFFPIWVIPPQKGLLSH